MMLGEARLDFFMAIEMLLMSLYRFISKGNYLFRPTTCASDDYLFHENFA